MTARFQKNCWIYLGSSGQKTLANSSNNSKIAGFTVSSHKGSILKGTGHSMEQQVYDLITKKKKILFRNFLITLCSSHTPGSQSCFNQLVSLNNQMAMSQGGQLLFTTAIINVQFCSYIYLEDSLLMTTISIQNTLGVLIKC